MSTEVSGGGTENEEVKMGSEGDNWDICPWRSVSGWNPENEKM